MGWDRVFRWLSTERDGTGAVADDAGRDDVGAGTDASDDPTSSGADVSDEAAAATTDAPGDAATSVATGSRCASRGPEGVAATDGGNATAADGSGTPRWTGDDPISFEADESPDRDAVVRPEDVVEDPIDFDGSDADALLDAVAVDDVGDRGGADGEPSPVDDLADEDPEEAADAGPTAVDGTDLRGAAAGDSERDVADELDGSGTDRAVDEPVREGVEGTDAGAQDVAVDALRARLESVEDGHERVTSSVEELEAEMEGLHDQVDGVRANLETLVDLVRETAATRGGGTTAAASGDGQTPSSPAAAEPTPTAATNPSPTEEESESADEEQSSTADVSTSASGTDDPTSAPHTDGPTASTASSGATAADPDDPRSDAAAERLRDLGADFEADEDDQRHVEPDRIDAATQAGEAAGDGVSESGEVADSGSDGASDVGNETDAGNDGVAVVGDEPGEEAEDAGGERDALADRSGAASSLATAHDLGGFEFQKVVLPAEDGGQAEVVGDDLAPPYLGAVPDGYAAEAAVIEWFDGLVEAADESDALAALAYYESVGWLTAEVRAALARYLVDVQAVDVPSAPAGPPDGLDAADHRRSLEFVIRLAEGDADDGATGDAGVSADGI